jgi:hypothetical protein
MWVFVSVLFHADQHFLKRCLHPWNMSLLHNLDCAISCWTIRIRLPAECSSQLRLNYFSLIHIDKHVVFLRRWSGQIMELTTHLPFRVEHNKMPSFLWYYFFLILCIF